MSSIFLFGCRSVRSVWCQHKKHGDAQGTDRGHNTFDTVYRKFYTSMISKLSIYKANRVRYFDDIEIFDKTRSIFWYFDDIENFDIQGKTGSIRYIEHPIFRWYRKFLQGKTRSIRYIEKSIFRWYRNFRYIGQNTFDTIHRASDIWIYENIQYDTPTLSYTALHYTPLDAGGRDGRPEKTRGRLRVRSFPLERKVRPRLLLF